MLCLPAKEPESIKHLLPQKQEEKEQRDKKQEDDAARGLLEKEDNRHAHQEKDQSCFKHGGPVGLPSAAGKMAVQAAAAQDQWSSHAHHDDVGKIQGKFADFPGFQREDVRQPVHADVVSCDHGGGRQQAVDQLQPDPDLADIA